MYSMVLMVAMTASPEAAAFGNGGCNGCGGGLFSGRGCHGSSCHGGLFNGHGCQGSSCHGGLFSGHGCQGSSCHGCHGGLFSGHGCQGSSCHGCHGGLFRGHGCQGGCIGAACYGCQGGGIIIDPKKAMPTPEKKGGITSAPAYIAVNVPAEATITIDGAPTKSTSTSRIFSTPELNAGTVYYYTLVAEVVRDGKTLVAVEKVAVEAGARVQISLNPSVAAEVAGK